MPSRRLSSILRHRWAPDAAILAVAFVATLVAEWRTIVDPAVYPVDATIHTYWMARFDDPALFAGDPLTENRPAQVPPLLLLLYRVGSLVVAPTTFGQVLPLVVVPLAVWLLFRITREVARWPAAAWVASLLYLFAWDVHRFSGGHARAFAVPIVLGVALLGLRDRDRAAATVPVVGALLYPPGALTGLAVLGFSWFRWRRPFGFPLRRLLLLALAVGLAAAAVLLPRVVSGRSATPRPAVPRVEMREAPEYGPNGQRRFYSPSRKQFLRQNRSGFDLARSGSIIAVAAGLLLLMRPRNARLLRKPVVALPLAGLTLFALAHLLLPRLYWPHRYTYPLVPFGCLVVGVALRPTLEAAARRARWLAVVAGLGGALLVVIFALTAFPLGPEWDREELGAFARPAALLVGAAVVVTVAWVLVRRRPASGSAPSAIGPIAAIAAAAVLIGSVAAGGGLRVEGDRCPRGPLSAYLSTLPKDAVIAGDPVDMTCVPLVAQRPVVMSRKLYGVRHRDRMRDLVDAYYGGSVEAILRLRERYGAEHLVVRPDLLLARDLTGPWRRMEPFTSQRRRLMRSVPRPAALELPIECRTYEGPRAHVVDLACVERELG